MRPDLDQQIDAVRALTAAWDDSRAAAVQRGMKRRRLQRRVGYSVLATAVLVAAGFIGFPYARDPDVVVAPFNSGADVRVLPQEGRFETALLTEGGAWFDVRPNPNRTFRVQAGDVVVEVLGTRFAVDRAERGVRVLVDHGRVRVKWKDGERILTNGQEGWFPLMDPAAAEAAKVEAAQPEPVAVAMSEPEPAAAPVVEAAPMAKPKAILARAKPVAAVEPARTGPSWQELAKGGEHDKAFVELQRTTPPDLPEELLLAADVARLSRHPDQAVEPLKQLLAKHPDDGRAPLAAFTLGRVLLDQLSQPRAAAEAFGRARALDPNGPLAEDALARHVGAAALAGDREEATRLATEYLTLFPEGRSVRAVKHHGGLK